MAVDISGIKTAMKSLLDTANTTTAAFDLSTGLSRRVCSVNKYNPERIVPNGGDMPSVFIWTQAKRADPVTINQTLALGKRRAELLFSLAGVVWVPYTTTNTEDPADTDCEKLMENIEEVLRASDTLGATVRWHLEPEVTYHSAPSPNDEDAHLRVGIMSVRATVYY